MDRLKPYIEVQKQIVEKQVEEKMNNNETLSDSEQEINARNKKDSPMINTKSRSGRTVSGNKHNEYYYY